MDKDGTELKIAKCRTKKKNTCLLENFSKLTEITTNNIISIDLPIVNSKSILLTNFDN
jgi:hypothetical protein